MRFIISQKYNNGICEQCGKIGEIFNITLSLEEKSVSKLLCRNCALKAKQYVDKRNQATQAAAQQNFERKVDNNEVQSLNEKRGKGNSPSKRIIAALLALVIVLSGAAIGTVAVIKRNKAKKGTDSVGEASIGEIYYQETPAEHIAKADAGIMYADNELLVVAKDGVKKSEIEELAKKFDATIVGYIEKTGDYQWQLNNVFSKDDLDNYASEIETEDTIESAYPNYFFEMQENTVSSDVNYGTKWKSDLKNSTDNKGKSWGVEAIKAPTAWKLMDEHKSEINPVAVGVIDNGFDKSHEDLPFTQPPFYNDSFKIKKLNSKKKSHGTHVSGTFAADGTNDLGICGVYPYGKDGGIFAASYKNDDDRSENTFGSSISQIVCFAELILRNVKVINCSYGFGEYHVKLAYFKEINDITEIENYNQGIDKGADALADFLHRMILKKYDFVIVTAAGNESNESYDLKIGNKKVKYKASDIPADTASHLARIPKSRKEAQSNYISKDYGDVYDRIIVVGAIDKSYKRCIFSNNGKRVDIYAPGKGIYSTTVNNGYNNFLWDGTSMASPHVAGVAASVWSINNRLSGPDVKSIVINSTNTEYLDLPIINMEQAVKVALGSIENESFTESIGPNQGAIMGWVVDGDSLTVSVDNGIKTGAIPRAEFIVKNAKTGKEIEGAFITDNSGHFEFILPPGKYNLTVNASGYEPYSTSEPVEVNAQQVTYLDDWIKLKKRELNTIEASSTDFSELNNMLKYVLARFAKFDIDDSNAQEEATDLLFTTRWPFISLLYYYDTVTDPQNDEGTKTEIGYSGEKVDEILRNVFGVTPSHSGKKGVWYYSNGKYFEVLDAGCGPSPREVEIARKTKNSDGTYTINARARSKEGDADGTYYSDFEKYTLKVKLFDLNGKRQWRITSIAYEGDESVTTIKIETSSYKEAYREVLNNYLKEHSNTQYAAFSLAYLDNDEIPELLISEGEWTYATVYIYSYDGSKAFFVGNYGSYGSFAYVERQGTIVLYYDKHGADGLQSYTAVLKKSGSTYKTSWLAMDTSSNYDAIDVDELNSQAIYEVNGKRVSLEEYGVEYHNNVPSDTEWVPTASQEGSHSLTQSEINKLL